MGSGRWLERGSKTAENEVKQRFDNNLLWMVGYRRARASFGCNLPGMVGLALLSTVGSSFRMFLLHLSCPSPSTYTNFIFPLPLISKPPLTYITLSTILHLPPQLQQNSTNSGEKKRATALSLYLSWLYYPDLVLEFYANILHKMDKDLPTIISHVKGVRIVLERDRLASILGILDNGNTITVDSNRRAINDETNWNFDVACSNFNIQHRTLDLKRIIHRGTFPSLLPRALAYFFGHTDVQKRGRFSEVSTRMMIINRAATSDSIHNIQQLRLPMEREKKEWILTSEEDRLRDCSAYEFKTEKLLRYPIKVETMKRKQKQSENDENGRC
ncbi:hypothetical protein M9H77_02454 [Catharanthus roseus]|uniref:Uncharacterized protein n=1 Tax=Catharanthus roseus TaxID=4058 RepID=A0ACC0C8N0_CATRO|nr:hypothetical protein M9H77_02454 [Catharanthus roseus]